MEVSVYYHVQLMLINIISCFFLLHSPLLNLQVKFFSRLNAKICEITYFREMDAGYTAQKINTLQPCIAIMFALKEG